MQLPEGVIEQARSIGRNWGQAAARRYLARYEQAPRTKSVPLRTTRWVSNTQHQPKQLSELEAATIRAYQSSGDRYRAIAKSWGISQGTVSNVCNRRGAYRPKDSTFDFQKATLVELHKKTKIAQQMWCRWFGEKQQISSKSLTKAASALGMKEVELMDAIEKRKSRKRRGAYRPKDFTFDY